MESDIIAFVVNLVIAMGIIIGAWLIFMGVMVRRLEARLTQELADIAEDVENDKLIALTVEVDGDQFLCYNSKDMAFVCQGRDLEEIRERFRQRYPAKNAAIYNGDESALAVLKKQLKEQRENSSGLGSAS